MRERLVVSGPLPPSSNSLYPTGRDGKRHLSAKGKAYKEKIQKRLMVDKALDRCPDPPFSLHLHLRFPDARRRDCTNQIKLLEDSIFQYLGFDDSLIYDVHIWKYIDRADPGMTVEIRHCSRRLEGRGEAV